MQGIGNDFIVISPLLDKNINKILQPNIVKYMANRHYGIGADQILFIDSYAGKEADYEYRILNADGTEVEQCGNGARCVTKFLKSRGFLQFDNVKLKCQAGILESRLLPDESIEVKMTPPKLGIKHVGFNMKKKIDISLQSQNIFSIPWKNSQIIFSPVSMGNPHAVININYLHQEKLERIFDYINESDFFMQGINVGFCISKNINSLNLRVFERGVGETLACGSGACAAVVSGISSGNLKPNFPVDVKLRGGVLKIRWSGNINDSVFMSGPAEEVFEGKIFL